MTGLGVV